MDNETEAYLALCIFIIVLLIVFIGVLVYVLLSMIKQHKEQGLRQNVLIDSMIEVLSNRYKFYDEDEDQNSGGSRTRTD